MTSEKLHHYALHLDGTGNPGPGTASWRGDDRTHRITAPAKATVIEGSSDPAFRGDLARWNPEELLLAAVAACHQRRYLDLCAAAGIVVTSSADAPEATLLADADGSGRIIAALRRSRVRIAKGHDPVRAASLHADAHEKCFVAQSVNFPIGHQPTILVRDTGA